ncbi:PepSY domain-containing protein [Magnetospirillum sp. J10]|uniref:PepSY domain-containing protein n=2 Tax=Magnetospirillum sulfuroxidans TaxID=611300 RepID=A0ABS5I983_9PROT|nr:PepSY domain-containing protein [Magnetospirillum sulfuroxidans]
MNWKAIPIIALFMACPTAWAGESDHDRARRAVEDGRILPLREILTRAETAYPGQLIEAELEDDHGKLIYEIKLLTKDGRLMKLIYDAASGEVLKVRQRDRP